MNVSHQQLLSLISYDKQTGVVTWTKTGKRAGTVCISRKKKYRSITIAGNRKREHCWIWYLVTGYYPSYEIDHKNGDGTDNRLDNIILVTSSVNRHNHRLYSSNKSGITGVFWSNKEKSWIVNFVINGKQEKIAQRKDFFEACCIRKSLERQHDYSPEHGSNRPY